MDAKVHPGARRAAATLLVEGGLNAGAEVALHGTPCRVGRDRGNEVVLADDLLASIHFMLERREGVHWLSALGGPVAHDGTVLAAGKSVGCRDGMTLQAGGTLFRLSLPSTPAPVRAPARLRWGVVTAFAAGATFAAVALLAVPLDATGIPAPVARTVAAAPAAAAAPMSKPSGTAGIAEALNQHMAAAGLGGIALTVLADGSIEARGEVMPQLMQDWRQAQRWFDAEYARKAVLVDHVATSAAAPPLAIQAVWPGRNPYVIDASGQKLFAGAALRDGWAVESIEAARVLIRRGGQVLAVRF